MCSSSRTGHSTSVKWLSTLSTASSYPWKAKYFTLIYLTNSSSLWEISTNKYYAQLDMYSRTVILGLPRLPYITLQKKPYHFRWSTCLSSRGNSKTSQGAHYSISYKLVQRMEKTLSLGSNITRTGRKTYIGGISFQSRNLKKNIRRLL